LRALAVIAVLLYHADLRWIPGGFLGVDVFFVISGYLITMLLLSEHQRSGAISVRGFYLRRARRLLPALFALLLSVTATVTIFYHEELAQLRGQVVAALTYCTNWYLIFTGNSYFQNLGRPLVLRHLWSLAVEEQFYLLWPLLLALMLRRWRGRLGPIAVAIIAASTASAVWMAVLYHPGRDPSRVYYGTDTRAFTLLLGALLALFWRPSALSHARVGRQHGHLFDFAGLLAVGAILVFFLNAHETSNFLYRGGFLLLAIVSACAIAAVVHPGATFTRALFGNGVVTWIGVRSYALYLWHWPIYVLTRPRLDWPIAPLPDLAIRLGLTFLAADLSYRFVEVPIRRDGFRVWLRHLLRTDHVHRGRRPVGGTIVLASTAVVAVLLASLATAKAPLNPIAESLRAGQAAIAGTPAPTAPPETATPPTVPTLTTLATAGSGTGHGATTATTVGVTATHPPATVARTTASAVKPATLPPTHPTPPPTVKSAAVLQAGPIVAFGDSVMLGAAPALLQTFGPGTVIDAKVGRTLWPVIGIAQLMQAEHRLGSRVLIHLGDNGGLDPDLIARTMASLKGVARVVWMTVKVPRSWEAGVNATLHAEIPKYPNARLLDWKALATDPSMFYEDGIHLKPAGARFYAGLVQKAFAAP
jgi:peptidoglycan/LPS O-acetylase OafA/YrhL